MHQVPTPRGPRTPAVALLARTAATLVVAWSSRPTASRSPQKGATSAEYALMLTLIAVVIIGAVRAFGANAAALFVIPASAF